MSDALPSNYDQSLYSAHNRLFFRLFQVGNTLDRKCSNELGISPVHWAVLGALSRPRVQSGMSFSDLTEYLGVSRQNLDAVLKRLERDGLVQRIISEHDRRAKNVALTAEGLKTWESLQDDFFNFYGQALNTLAFDDVVTLIHLLNKVNDGLKSIKIEKQTAGS
ncbi:MULTISPECIES: MarR family winged helix-turn-helix transcriptional regulator [unclassified Acinetobacter]|uniref:MarR family winged helix-turn-helix transcriptional regulator n=1 Tax=unclassified Acinetobacter TaxID=196816 RepID=UPI001C21CCC6|nr:MULTISPECIES: MarR family transcriptional regulator [unclassified Acinetobacter]